MLIGVPKEIKPQENRIGLTPDSVKVLTSNGHKVLVEKNSGYEAGFENEQYKKSGAKIVNRAEDIFEQNAEETKRIYRQTVESRFPDTRVHVYYQPVGVVAALSPWNFPLVLSSRKISTALAAVCSVIIKPDVITP